ncbi:MAG TPA: type II toxin-antitoxin system Phd/YefM family antitoxin [Terriglobales bacterium]|nr:type II toxin-antitoxin system Phd/YefM family antitoxin [Terriglobales bacterium]
MVHIKCRKKFYKIKRVDNKARDERRFSNSSQVDLANNLVHYKRMEVNIHDAKTNLSKLLQRVATGEEITIAKAGVPVARLVPIQPVNPKRELGVDREHIRIADDFDAPLPADILDAFEGRRPRRKR